MFIAPIVQTPHGERSLEISFGVPDDATALRSWKIPAGHPDPIAARDSVEFARLAGKRWRYYARHDDVAKSLADLIARTARAQREEIGFLLVGKPSWKPAPSILAMAWCRRTWCHHLVLDFLACHPSAFDKRLGYGGVGSAMLVAQGFITAKLGVPLIWGEATAVSAGFYSKKVLGGRKVLDHFFIEGKHLARLQRDGLRYAR